MVSNLQLNLQIIDSFAEKHDIIAGACHAAPLDLARLASPFVPFVSPDMAKRTDPHVSLRGVKSIVVIGVGFSNAKNLEVQEDVLYTTAPNEAQLSSLGVNNDYHVRVKNLLRKLVAELKVHGDFKHKILVDSPYLDERALAERAGIGFFGRNGLIISKKFGSYFNIGCLLTTLELPHSLHRQSHCLSCPPDCNLCIKSCPAGALGGGNLNAVSCISYLTQKDKLSPEEEKLLGGQLYGCDICQDVCPFNAKKQVTRVNPQEWLDMSDEAFNKKYGDTAMLWRGAEILRRNAHIAACSSDRAANPSPKILKL